MANISLINKKCKYELHSFIDECENRYINEIDRVLSSIENSECSALIIAGPSCAGKTTTSQIIANKIASDNKKVFIVSLDDYFHSVDIQKEKYGEKTDFDSINALDVDFFKSQFSDILNGKEVSLPRFDFISGKRIENHCKIQMKKNDFLIVEGIHSLNPVISNEFSHKTVKSLFINVEDEISNDEKTLLNARQLRLVRRIVRDFNFRGSSVENTFHLWKNVVKNEDLSLLPFREDADFQINTFIEYECGVMKEQACNLLSSVSRDSKYQDISQEMLNALNNIVTVDKKFVTKYSMLKEFVG